MSDSTWLRLVHKGVKLHVVPHSLRDTICFEIESRSRLHHLETESLTKFFEYDQGGPVWNTEPKMHAQLSGLNFTFRVGCLSECLLDLQHAPVRGHGDEKYLKLKGAYSCLVLRPEHRSQLEAELQKALKPAADAWKAFLDQASP